MSKSDVVDVIKSLYSLASALTLSGSFVVLTILIPLATEKRIWVSVLSPSKKNNKTSIEKMINRGKEL